MLQLIRTLPDSDVQELQEERFDSGIPQVLDYNPSLKTLTTVRTAYVITGWDAERLKTFLTQHPKACIWNTASHYPIPVKGEKLETLAEEQIVTINGSTYIDVFGRYVYILSQVSWEAKEDVDKRFDGFKYPEVLEPEFLIYQ